MKKLYFLFFSTLLLRTASAQVPALLIDNTNVKRCATVEVLDEARRNHPGAETDAQFENWINQVIQQRNNAGRINVNYNLPVVFHIIASGEAVGATSNNISAAAITQQIIQLNKDYANLSNSPYSVAGPTGLQFSLAQKNPSGNVLAEPGIDRINYLTYGFTNPATTTYQSSYVDGTVKPATYWDPEKYINIWLIPTIASGTNSLLGYATFPASSTLTGLNNAETNATAGVVIATSTVGSVFTPYSCSATYGQGRTLTHELGHFFGLRHIWGDANCGDDYVGDTPVHQTSNYGVPTHPKPNTCGTADEMFEDYMDYCDDVALNTFTTGQTARIQTVMANSPRRVNLATSPAGLIAATATNRIAFSNCTGAVAVSETGITGTYPRSRSINLYLNVEDKATGAATVTFVTGGTAISGRDYTLPASVVFASGDSYKPITLNILDNATVDGTRTLTLSYTISGSGVTAGTSAQSLTITITDDDNFATTQNQITLINENFEGALPGWATLSNGGPNTFTVSTNGRAGGSGICAHVTNNTTTRANSYTKTTASLAVLRTPLLNTSGLQNLNVTFNYRVWGEVASNTAYDFGQLRYSTVAAPNSIAAFSGATGVGPYAGITDSVTAVANAVLPASFNNSQFYLCFYWNNDAADGNDPPLNVDNLIVRGDGVVVETTVSSSYGYDVPSATVNNFRSTNGRSVLALSAAAANLTNVTAAVTEAGTDRPTFAANGTTYLRSRKVITLTASPASNTQYTVKLYYTAAELAAWGTAVSGLKIMKVNNGVSLSAGLNNSNAVIVTPSQFEDSTTSRGYYAFTATVTGGGQFVLVQNNAALPVKLLSFTGVLDKNQTRLNWVTTAEVNNLGFAVERSTDAATFAQIGWVDASAGNKYELYDASITKGNKYYYRLKQVDRDGNKAYSPVVTVAYLANGSITVFPNPVKNDLVIQQSGNGRTSVVVTDLAGKTVYSNTFAAGTLQINAQPWSKGVYMVRVINSNEESTFKVIKE